MLVRKLAEMVRTRAARSASVADRAHAMAVAAEAVLSAVRRRHRAFLADCRSVLDRPGLADVSDPVVAEFITSYDTAVEAVGECAGAEPVSAARALAAAYAAEYAASLADQHARRLARHGIYPHVKAPLDVRGLDRIEEARASLELAADAATPHDAAGYLRRAAVLAESVGIGVPELLGPAWQALFDAFQAADVTTR